MARRALLIANDSYHDSRLSSLFAPVGEAETLRDLLRDPRVGGFSPTDLLANESKAEIERAVERLFTQAGPDDLLLLYFSGHGVRNPSGRLHLAVSNTELDFLASTSISGTFLKEQMSETDAAAVVVLLDCCYSGAISDGFKADGPINIGEALQAGQGRYILTATSALERAADGSQAGGQSAFTEIVVRGLSTGEADGQGNGRITPGNLWSYISREMPKRSTMQSPTQYGQLSEEIDLARVKHGIHTVTDTGTRVHLGDLLGRLTQTPEHGLQAEEWMGTGRFIVPVGRVLRDGHPAEVVPLNLAQSDGHLAVVGRPGSGKSTFLRTLVGALSVTHGPDDARFVFLESGGNRLGSLGRLPHVERTVLDHDPDEVRGVLHAVSRAARRRRDLYLAHEIESPSHFRQLRAELETDDPDHPRPDVFLIIDRWAEFAESIDDFTALVRGVASNGLEYGLHVVIAARKWDEIPTEIAELMRGKVELALSRPSGSEFDARLAEQLHNDQPGWALHNGLRFRVAIPQLESDPQRPESFTDSLSDGAPVLIDRVLRAWRDREDHPRLRPWGMLEPPAKDERPEEPSEISPPARAEAPSPAPRRLDTAPSGRVEASMPVAQARPPRRPAPAARYTGSPDVAPRWEELLDFDQQGESSTDPERFREWLTGKRRTISDQEQWSVPIGATRSGEVVTYPATPVSTDQTPPHTLVAGGHGSGISDAISVILLGIAVLRTPEEHNVAILSFRSGIGFERLRDLPHVVAFARRLGDDLDQVERFRKLVEAEIAQRRRMRDEGTAMPTLTLVCDGYGQMGYACEEFDRTLIEVAQVGPPLGVHLILSTDRPEGTAELQSALTERIATRTYTSGDSRYVVGIPDAAELPSTPGGAYLWSGSGNPIRLRLAAVSDKLGSRGDSVRALLETSDPPSERGWPAPIHGQPELTALLAGTGEDGPQLCVPVGVTDDVANLRVKPLWLDFHHDGPGGGNLLVTGEPFSGKTRLLRTIVASMTATHSPARTWMYIVDFTQDSYFEDFEASPHVGDVATPDRLDLLRRMLWEMDSFPRLPESGSAPRDATDVFLIVSSLDKLHQRAPRVFPLLERLVRDGPRHGVHVVAAMDTGPIDTALMRLMGEFRSPVGARVIRTSGQPQDTARLPDGREFVRAREFTDRTESTGETATVGGAPPIPLLPKRLLCSQLSADPDNGIAVGMRESDLGPAELHFDDNHPQTIVLVGAPGSGKTSTLATMLRRFASHPRFAERAVSVFDLDGSLLPRSPDRPHWKYGKRIEEYSGTDPDQPGLIVIDGMNFRALPDVAGVLGLRSHFSTHADVIIAVNADNNVPTPTWAQTAPRSRGTVLVEMFPDNEWPHPGRATLRSRDAGDTIVQFALPDESEDSQPAG